MKIKDAMFLIDGELRAASEGFPPMRSPHEGIAIIREEYLELEHEVFHGDHEKAIEEAIQLGAMAARFLVDMTETKTEPQAEED